MQQTMGFHVMAKPMGPVCNLQCKYCFYLEKHNLFDGGGCYRMSDDVLEAYISRYITEQDVPEITFVWQGGEPTLAAIAFYEKALALQRKYAGSKKILNSIQTNGTQLSDVWCDFLKQHHFLVGISLDGPGFLHDKYRVQPDGSGSFHLVLATIERLNRYRIPYNVLVTVSRESCAYGKRIYQFLKTLGATHMQFTPLIERMPQHADRGRGLHYAAPRALHEQAMCQAVTDFTVEPEAYGDFLIDVFNEWVERDVGKIFLHNVEDIFPVYLGLAPTMCIYTQNCGGCMIVEHNGDVYSCDHFMYPEYRLGNVKTDGLDVLAHCQAQTTFGAIKGQLPLGCQMCEMRSVCGGGCPKHRFLLREGDALPTHYLCAGYRKFYRHIHRYMKAMAQLVANGLPATEVMALKDGPLIYMKSRKEERRGGTS